jgi:hypothetical protein
LAGNASRMIVASVEKAPARPLDIKRPPDEYVLIRDAGQAPDLFV